MASKPTLCLVLKMSSLNLAWQKFLVYDCLP
jgi:hypothetical protein